MLYYFDPIYFWYVFIPAMLISLVVQIYLQSSFAKWSKTRNASDLTGQQVGQQLFDRTSLKAIPLEHISGSLTDHFDPRANVVRLSDTVANQKTVAAMAVAAHELGHVQQYQTGSVMIGLRNFLLPALQFSPILSYITFFLGFVFNMTNMIWIGVFFFGVMVLFSILTLPIEINASRRALKLLREADLVKSDAEATGVRQVLNAAAMTYLAAAITSLLQLFYYISVAKRQSRRA